MRCKADWTFAVLYLVNLVAFLPYSQIFPFFGIEAKARGVPRWAFGPMVILYNFVSVPVVAGQSVLLNRWGARRCVQLSLSAATALALAMAACQLAPDHATFAVAFMLTRALHISAVMAAQMAAMAFTLTYYTAKARKDAPADPLHKAGAALVASKAAAMTTALRLADALGYGTGALLYDHLGYAAPFMATAGATAPVVLLAVLALPHAHSVYRQRAPVLDASSRCGTDASVKSYGAAASLEDSGSSGSADVPIASAWWKDTESQPLLGYRKKKDGGASGGSLVWRLMKSPHYMKLVLVMIFHLVVGGAFQFTFAMRTRTLMPDVSLSMIGLLFITLHIVGFVTGVAMSTALKHAHRFNYTVGIGCFMFVTFVSLALFGTLAQYILKLIYYEVALLATILTLNAIGRQGVLSLVVPYLKTVAHQHLGLPHTPQVDNAVSTSCWLLFTVNYGTGIITGAIILLVPITIQFLGFNVLYDWLAGGLLMSTILAFTILTKVEH